MRRRGGRAGAINRDAISAVPPERDHFEAYSLKFDERGRLWVRTERAAAGRTIFDVFDPTGHYLGEVEAPAQVSEFALGVGVLAAAASDSLGVQRIRTWTVSGPERRD